jgi:uncharacterized membrane protein
MSYSSLKKTLTKFNRLKAAIGRLLKTKPYELFTIIAIIIYGIVFSYFTIQKNTVFQSYAWDLGIFNQALYTTLHNGKLFYYTVELYLNPSGSYFAVHFSPILFLLLPFYAINPSPTTLLVIQSFALSLGALPLYLLAKELLKSNKAAFMLAIAYLLYPALQGANWFDFHSPALLPLLFFSLCYFMVTHRWKLYFPFVLLALMVQEQAVFPVLIIAVYYFLISGNLKSFFRLNKPNKPLKMDEKLASIITLLICIVYYAFSVYVKSYFPINPEYLQTYKALQAFNVAGVQVDPILFPFYLLSNPQNAFNALMYDYPLKFLYIILLFGPLIFIPFKSKLSIGVLALLALFLFSNYSGYYMVGNQYPLYVLPLIFVAAIYGLRKFEFRVKSSILKTILIVTLLFIVSASPISPVSNTFAKDNLLWYPVFSLAPNENTVSLNDLVNVIPPNASVLTQNTIFPHVSSRVDAYAIPLSNVVSDTGYIQSLINKSEFVLLDLTQLQDANSQFVFNEITQNNSYGAYALANEAILFKRGFHGEPMFANYTEYRVFSAYKDLMNSSFSQIVSDPSAVSEKVVLCPENSTGYFVYGPYTYLLPGSYEVTFTVKVGEHNSSRLGGCDVSSSFGDSIVSKRDIFGFELQPDKWTNFTLAFTSTKLLTDIEFRAFSYGAADMYVDRVIMNRISPNATSDFGLRTFDDGDLPLASGYASNNGFLVFQQNTTSSTFWYGPYVNLPAGKYRATFLLNVSPLPQEPTEHILTLGISSNAGKYMFAKYDVTAADFLKENASDWQEFSLEFIATGNITGVEFTGLNPSPNFNITLAYIMVEQLALTPELNYEVFSVKGNLQVEAGQIVNDASSSSGEAALSQKGLNEGILTYGPYITLPNGTFNAVFRIKTYDTSQNATILLEVVSQAGNLVLSTMTLSSAEIHDGSWFNVTLPFSLEALTPNIEFRASSNGMTNLYVDTVTVLFPQQ